MSLSARQTEILRRLGYGQSVTDIAEALGIAVKTVSTHRARLLEKLHLPHTASLIRYAIRHGYSPDDPDEPAERRALRIGGAEDTGE